MFSLNLLFALLILHTAATSQAVTEHLDTNVTDSLVDEDGPYNVNGTFSSLDGEAIEDDNSAIILSDSINSASASSFSSKMNSTTFDAKDNLTIVTSEVSNGEIVQITTATTKKKCVPLAYCFKDTDCDDHGTEVKGRCVGVYVGKCDCSACMSGIPCKNESTCGGLRNSCKGVNAACDCIKAHKLNGYANFGEALLKLCNHRDCDGDTDTCFGLPCRRGRCFCPRS